MIRIKRNIFINKIIKWASGKELMYKIGAKISKILL